MISSHYNQSDNIKFRTDLPNRMITEDFELSSENDADWTDAMSDSDQETEDLYIFIMTLRSAIQLYVQNENGKAVYKKGTDPSLDILFKTSVTGTVADGYDVRLFSCPAAEQMLSNMYGRADAAYVSTFINGHDCMMRVRQTLIYLDLSALPADFPIWRLPNQKVYGIDVMHILNVMSSADGSLRGMPEYVAGDVYAGKDKNDTL